MSPENVKQSHDYDGIREYDAFAFSLVFFTALAGRVWCGWACPQTVFMVDLSMLRTPFEANLLRAKGMGYRIDGPVIRNQFELHPCASRSSSACRASTGAARSSWS